MDETVIILAILVELSMLKQHKMRDNYKKVERMERR